jgi:hypothetical protein
MLQSRKMHPLLDLASRTSHAGRQDRATCSNDQLYVLVTARNASV